MYDYLFAPFVDYIFLRRALVACLALSLSCAPVGVLLVLRRMSLMGDALSHSILPGVAIGYLFAGLSLPAMGIGGLVAGILVALLAGFVARRTHLREDASFVGFYLIALSSGAVIVSLKGSQVDLLHILFGSILAVTPHALLMIVGIASLTLVSLALIYRPLIVECFDPQYMRGLQAKGALYHNLFIVMVVVNMVAAFQGLGTLMALGLMMLPAIAARFWARHLGMFFALAVGIALLSSVSGLLLSYHFTWPSGPAIVMIAGFIYLVSLLFGGHGGLLRRSDGHV